MGIKYIKRNMSSSDAIQLIVLGFIMVSFIISLIQTIERLRRAEASVKDAEKVTEELRINNQKLKERIDAVDTPEFIEQQLRDRLGYSKEGEVVFVLPDDETLKSLVPKEEVVEKKLPPSNWEKWMERLF